MNNKISLDTSKDEDLSKVIDAITTVKNEDVVKSNSIITDDFDKVVKRLCEKNFRIAVIGEFSSGKSTFLNALIGKDILKHGRLETTATITECELPDFLRLKRFLLFIIHKIDTLFTRPHLDLI